MTTCAPTSLVTTRAPLNEELDSPPSAGPADGKIDWTWEEWITWPEDDLNTDLQRPKFCNVQAAPPELRLKIWEAAVQGDYQNRIIPLTRDTKRIIPITRELRHPSAVFETSIESRQAALGLYDQVIPVVPFFSVPTDFDAQQEVDSAGAEADAQHRGIIHVSLRHDIFLVSPETRTFQANKMGNFQPSSSRGPPVFKTVPIGPELRARIVRVLEHYDVNAERGDIVGATDQGVMYPNAEYPSARVCYYGDNPDTDNLMVSFYGKAKNLLRLLWHLEQGYKSDQLLEWLDPVVCIISTSKQ
ncbi:hypothetical protein PG997_008685 [Apiospora hydei]|uniref:2EXR domain-containing protein n=1 Tax=Apiospora hydei TaxID=1337664 RepID=A0ABR1WBK1_9PEZI